MMKKLENWIVLDFETTGADPSYDHIIDVGFLEFNGTKLVKKYQSLVQYEGELSSFIQKLTGITPGMLSKAPKRNLVENELQELIGKKVLAHNSDFEKSFLDPIIHKISKNNPEEKVEYLDSMLLLSILFPEESSLKLENFIKNWKIREVEEHRGLSDAIDLLKVILTAVKLIHTDHDYYQRLTLSLLENELNDFAVFQFVYMTKSEIDEISLAIDFPVDQHVEYAKEYSLKKRFPPAFIQIPRKKHFPLEFSGKNIQEIFSNETVLKEFFSNFKKRQSQIDLALKVGQSFKNKVHSIIQAPTGTGKTFGYLIPAALFAHENKEQVLIATGTKTLQTQAFEKDVPKVRDFLGLEEDELKVKLLMGSGNHLCELLYREERNDRTLMSFDKDFEDKFSDLYFDLVFYLNTRLKPEDKILRADIPYVLKKKFESIAFREKNVAVDFRSCSGFQCPFKFQCSYMIGLKEAKEADIIIGNHSLMFTWPKGLNRPLNIVIDEAHKIEEEATEALGIEVDETNFLSFVQSMSHLQGIGSLFYLLANNEENEGDSSDVIKHIREENLKTYQMLSDHLTPLSESMGLYFKKMPKYTESYWNELPMINRETHQDILAQRILSHIESVHFILNSFLQYLIPYNTKFDLKNLKSENEITAYTRFESFFSQLQDYEKAFLKMIEEDKNYCRSIKYLESEGFLLKASPIDVGILVKEHLLDLSQSVVYTSATIANGNGDTGSRGMEWSLGYSNLSPEKRFKTGFYLPSVYDYKNKTKVFLCDDVPALYDSKFVESILKKIMPLIHKLNGRTLLLFSAKTRFETAREILIKEFNGMIPLFIQGMGLNVVEDYKNSKNGILLGMESFGEGIDIPGDDLQFIFIDKIPDLRLDLVINERRNFFDSHIGNEFTDYYLSHRTRSLHQKLGRLIRTESDSGGVIIVDSRIKQWKGKTMEKLIKLMEPYHLERSELEKAVLEIENFILFPPNH